MTRRIHRRTFIGAAGAAVAGVGLGCSTEPAAADGGRGGVGDSGGGAPDGTSGQDAGPISSSWDARYDAALGPIPASAKWVAPDGDDGGAGTESSPYRTIRRALGMITGGGQIVLKDGTYDGADNWLNDSTGPVPSGLSDAQRTIIRAQNRFGARLTQRMRPAGYYDSIVFLSGARFVWIDGIIAEQSWTARAADDSASITIALEGPDNRLTRTIVKRWSTSEYGGSFAYGNGSVLEDCHSVGSGRYVFQGGTGGMSVPAGRSVLRRCTSTMAFGPSLQPSASFSFYGSNDGSYPDCRDVLFANCYEIDSPHFVRGSDAQKWGSFYHPKSVRNLAHIGCGSLGCGAGYGAFRTDNFGGDADLLATYLDCFVWDFNRGTTLDAAAFGKADNGRAIVRSCSAGNVAGPYLEAAPGLESDRNLFSSSIRHLTQRESGLGCEQLYAVGRFLSAYGEPGYDQVQADMPLWPFPYEAEFARIAAEPIPRPDSDLPTSVTASPNPYAGSALDGSLMTFTKRIWEATGTRMPDLATIYG